MKNKTILTLLFEAFIIIAAVFPGNYHERLEKYSLRAENLKEMISETGEKGKYAAYILQWSSPEDLSVITPEYLKENIDYAVKARQLPYCFYDDNIFMRYVLPPRISQEPFENWRRYFYEQIEPLVKNASNIEEAAVLVNLWVLEQMTFKPTNGRDQGPLTTLRRGYGRCEESMILFMAACRSVGIPVRAAYAPFWDFMDNNHAWVEVYTDDGWKFAGEAENGLSKTWFNEAAGKAPLVLTNVMGHGENEKIISFDGYSSRINSTHIYSDSKIVKVTLRDPEGNRVKKARVVFYALSYGGLFPVLAVDCSRDGIVKNEFGPAPLVCIGVSGEMKGSVIIDSRRSSEYMLQLDYDYSLEGEYVMKFSGGNYHNNIVYKPVMDGELFSLKRKNADLKRRFAEKNRLKTKEFAEHYDMILAGRTWDNEYYSNRMKFLDKCEKLGLNTDMYLNALKESSESGLILDIIAAWDEKDLCEISSREQLDHIADIFSTAKKRFRKSVNDEDFFEYVLKKTDSVLQPPENCWRKELLEALDLHLSGNLKKSAEQIIHAVDSAVTVEKRDFTYFTASLNPMEIFRIKHVTEYQKLLLTDAILKMYGVPVRWRGRLEYYNGRDFVPAEMSHEKSGDYEAGEFRLRIKVQGENVEPDPYGNFIVQYMDQRGEFKYAYFDGDSKDGVFHGSYRVPDSKEIYVCAYIRNKNGDGALRILPMAAELEINVRRLPVPVSERKDIPESVMDLIRENYRGGTEIYLFTEEAVSEPEIRMSEAMMTLEKAEYIIINKGKRVNGVLKKKNPRILERNMYGLKKPSLFLVRDGFVVFRTSGYKTGLETALKGNAEK